MEKVVREDLDQLNAVLTVHLPSTHYQPLFEKRLKDFRKKAQLKGFRKGQTPEGLVRKMYGRSILAEVVQDEINKQLQEYLREERPLFFGEPLIAEGQELHFDLADFPDYALRFELGLIPEFELQGLDERTTLPYPRVELDESAIDKQLLTLRRRHGDRQEITDGTVEDMDYLELHLEEWENGEKKPGGVHTHTQFLVNESMAESLRNTLMGKAIGDTFHFDPYEAEIDASEEMTRKYILHLEEDAPATSHDFLGRIDKITRVTPAELNEDFYNKTFGPGIVQDEAGARQMLRDQVAKSFGDQLREYVLMQAKVNLLEANPLPLPEAFLRRWLLTSSQEKQDNEEWTDEKFRRFFLDLRWSLVRDKMIEDHQLQVTEEEVITAYKAKLNEYFGGSADPMLLEQLGPRILQEKEFRQQLEDQIFQNKLADLFREKVALQEEVLQNDQLNEWMNTIVKAMEARFEKLA